MPSQITHALFTEQAYIKIFESSPPGPVYPWLVQGSAGPDPMFSNLRRKPSSEEWAHRIHNEGFGRVCEAMAERVREAMKNREEQSAALEAYFYGFCTHAVLDRAVHPLVNYLSGWEDPDDPETRHLRFCHPFLERIIDMMMLMDQKGMTLTEWKHGRRLPASAESATLLAPLLADAITKSYPGDAGDYEELEKSLENAFLDDGDFLLLYDPSGPGGDFRTAFEMEKRGELPRGILALFYPESIPAGDFLNEDGAGWVDPRTGGPKRCESFIDLYSEALEEAGEILKIAAGVVRDGRDAGELQRALGDSDLNDSSAVTGGGMFLYCDPMNISEIIAGMYAGL